MSIRKCIVTAIVVLACSAIVLTQERNSPLQPTILIVGTYHFSDERENISGSKRQKEIIELVGRLKTFKPTKVALEARRENSTINENYLNYLSDTYELSLSETEQIGFRIAKSFNHTKIYPVDWRNEFDLVPAMTFASSNDQGVILQTGMNKVNGFNSRLGEMIKRSSVLEIFRFLNQEETSKAVDVAMLTTLTHIGKDSNYVGTNVVAGWYERNLKIFTNIARIVDRPDDRILVIIGNGHTRLLRQFVSDHAGYNLERADLYLK